MALNCDMEPTSSFTLSPAISNTSLVGQLTPGATNGFTSSTPGGPQALGGRLGLEDASTRSLTGSSLGAALAASRASIWAISFFTCGTFGLLALVCRNEFKVAIPSLLCHRLAKACPKTNWAGPAEPFPASMAI